VALVTGGTSGIGAGAVRRLAAEGAKVVFTGSRAELGEALAQEVGGRFVSHRVEDAAAWPSLIESILAEHGRLDIAFANAGTEQGDANIEDVTIEGWSKLVGINQTGVMLTVQHAIRAMARNEGATGSIIVNSSMNAARPGQLRDLFHHQGRRGGAGQVRRGLLRAEALPHSRQRDPARRGGDRPHSPDHGKPARSGRRARDL
jgi:NAD(P)-dependent dehydrogenase (short-subunit alcohol dehydrogenase family)